MNYFLLIVFLQEDKKVIVKKKSLNGGPIDRFFNTWGPTNNRFLFIFFKNIFL